MTPRLTPREWQVARLVAERWSTAVIAHRLGISPRTVESHVRVIAAKIPGDGRPRQRIQEYLTPIAA